MRAAGLIMVLLLLGVGPLQAESRPERPETVSFELLPTKHMVISAKINGKGPYRFIFDTGAPVNVVSNRIARETGMVAKDSQPLFALFGSLGPAKIRALELGRLKAEDTPAVVMDHPAVELMGQAFGRIEGILGYPFFARYRMTLDYQAKRLTFTPSGFDPGDPLQSLMATVTALADDRPQPPRILAPAGLWGMSVQKAAEDETPGVTINAVHAGSAAAAAGLRAGDRLLTIDGRWTDSVADVYSAAAALRRGAEAEVGLRRGSAELRLPVKPRQGL